MAVLEKNLPGVFENPRVAGTTFAFDMKDGDTRNAFVNQRYQLGLMVYGAGARTLRFRINAACHAELLDDLFQRIEKGLRRLDQPDAQKWEVEGDARPKDDSVAVREVADADWPAIMAIEGEAYEPERQDSEEKLRESADAGVGLVAIDSGSGAVLGFCFGGKIEAFGDVDGPADDKYKGTGKAFYSADVTVSPQARGRGIGRILKEAQLDWARSNGFDWVTGRNRVGETNAMQALNRSLGAYEVRRYDNQYGGDGQADYYRIPLRAPKLPQRSADPLDLASGLQAPFGPAPAFMAKRELVGPAGSRLNLSNFATPDIVHYVEHLRLILPRGCGHLYFTSSQDELVDKTLRCLKLARPEGRMAVGFEGGFVGKVTGACRSLSDPRGFGEVFGLFDWPRLPHPADDLDGCLKALDEVVSREGAGSILAVMIETVGERSGKLLAGEAAVKLAEACRRHDLPLVLLETASGGYRNGEGTWGVDSLPAEVVPDAVLWYPGGQLGHVFVNARYYVDKPLTLISTWDGDEVSVIRTHEALRAARRLDLAPACAALDEVLGELSAKLGGVTLGGRGLYRTLSFADARAAESFDRAARAQGIRMRQGLPGTLAFAPSLDIDAGTLRGTVRDALMAAADAVG